MNPIPFRTFPRKGTKPMKRYISLSQWREFTDFLVMIFQYFDGGSSKVRFCDLLDISTKSLYVCATSGPGAILVSMRASKREQLDDTPRKVAIRLSVRGHSRTTVRSPQSYGLESFRKICKGHISESILTSSPLTKASPDRYHCLHRQTPRLSLRRSDSTLPPYERKLPRGYSGSELVPGVR